VISGRTPRRLARFCADEGGASALEFALVAGILIACILGVLQIGWAMQIRSQLALAADRAVRAVLLEPDLSDSEFEAHVVSELSEYDNEDLIVEAGDTTVGSVAYRTLSVTYEMPISVPGVPQQMVTLNVTRRVPDL